MSRKLAYWIVALLVLVTAIFANKQPAPGANWEALTKTRRKNAYTRNLLAFETFLKNQFGGLTECSFGYLYDGFKENTSWMDGTLLQDWKVVGHLEVHFYYDGLQPEPSSHEVHIIFKPALIEKAHSEEWKSLLQETLKQKELRTTYGDIQWFSFVDKQGDIDLTLRIPAHTRWYPNIPEYDRGYTDEMYFSVVPRAIRFVAKEIFRDPYTKVELETPTFNPPQYVSHRPLGIASGFIYPKDGPPLHLEIGTGLENNKLVTLHIQIEPWGKTWTEAQAKALIKPEVFDKLHEMSRGEIRIQGGPMDSRYYVAINGPLDAFPELPKPLR